MRMSFILTVICFFTITGVFDMSSPEEKNYIKKSWRLLAVFINVVIQYTMILHLDRRSNEELRRLELRLSQLALEVVE